MKLLFGTLALIIGFAAVTFQTPYHLKGWEIQCVKVGYDILSLAFWGCFIALLWRSSHSSVEASVCGRSMLGRGALAALLALVVFCLTIFVKQLAYGPYWSTPDRPMFAYGWPIPWKWETQGGTRDFLWVLPLNVVCCYGLMLFLCGFRKRKQFFIAFLCPVLILTGLGALMVGLKII